MGSLFDKLKVAADIALELKKAGGAIPTGDARIESLARAAWEALRPNERRMLMFRFGHKEGVAKCDCPGCKWGMR